MREWIDYFIINKSGLFDAHFYLKQYPEVRRADIDPLMHFIKFGWREDKNPGLLFDTRSYLESNPDLRQKNINPLIHYIRSGKQEARSQSKGFPLAPPRDDLGELKRVMPEDGTSFSHSRVPINLKSLPRLILHGLYYLRMNGFNKFNNRVRDQLGIPRNNASRLHTNTSEEALRNPYIVAYTQGMVAATDRDKRDYVDFEHREPSATPPLVKLIAFYLPQFHPFPENDAWWGKGFTEWTNVSKAVPQFVGHYQPRLPGELGFYDLRVMEIQHRQVELAKNYGIYGFCFHYYWFNSKRLLERPLDQFINDPQIDFPFCISWANENWTRKWDGRSSDILISQEHSFENDKLIVHDFVKLFAHPRYIRINGRPLLIVYRTDILQNANQTLEYWRKYSVEQGTGNPYLVMAQTFGRSDPRIGGFDAAVEFPPHNGAIIPEITHELPLLNNQYRGRVYRFSDMALSSIKRITPKPFRRFNTVSPGWDNDARTPGNGLTYTGSTPEQYSQWLDVACRFSISTQPECERFVFINAWNEWAEAAYIEPDRKFGYAYLQATADVLDGLITPKFRPRKIQESPAQKADATNYYQQMVANISNRSLLDTAFAQKLTTSNPDEIEKISLSVDCILSPDLTSESDTPLVSVIIPVYDHFEATLNCLKSILAAHDVTPIEIIFIDDGSTDERYTILRGCKSIRYMRNEQNLGFLMSCNKAAEFARGQYIILLNNDTMVLPGWLDSIMDTFRDNPGTGLVGSKLIYPDGRLQEAGGLMWNDGNGNNFGRDDDPEKPQYNYLRDADYCSGASICVPKSIWDEVNGFDDLFAPAYYEDTDLAFRIRKCGYSVLYQPFSRVIHLEGVTSGKSLTSGIKHYQEINREKFYTRWKDVLQDYGDGLQPSILYRNRTRRSHALLIDVCTPKPDHDSGSIDTYQYLLMLRKIGFEVTFISVVDAELVDHYVEDLQKRGIECIYAPYLVSIDEYIKQMGKYYDLVLLFRAPYGGQYINAIRKHAPQAKVVFNTVDLHFLREKREVELSGKGLKLHENLTRSEELGIMKKADATIVVSDYEQNFLASIGENSNSRVIPLPREAPGRTTGFKGREGIVFIGGYLHRPNVDAVFYFVNDIWPSISAAIPDCEFLIVGSNVPKELQELAGEKIKVVGFVANLADVFSQCKISVAPMRYGAGIKGKILTSLSYGVPCVATAIAAEGMGLTHMENILVGDTPAEFSAAVEKLYTDSQVWERISENGLLFVDEKYSLENFKKNLIQLVSDLGLQLHLATNKIRKDV